MATHARQQYFADESSLSKEKREFSIAEEVQQKIDGIEEGAQVNKIETIKVNGSEVQPDENKAVDLTIPGVVDSLDSTSSTDALSARQGKVLYDYIQDVSHIGHFLALWDASTGLPVTDPETSPYIYNTGDFYTVSVVAPQGGTNYKPDGTQYVIGQASTAVDTDDVEVNDFYFYDGATWRHMKNSGAGSIAVDGSLSTTSTNPVENRVITNALNGKADATDINTKTFYLSSDSDLTTAQAAYDWYLAGKNPLLHLSYDSGGEFYVCFGLQGFNLDFVKPSLEGDFTSGGRTYLTKPGLSINANSSSQVTGITVWPKNRTVGRFLDTDTNYSTPYTPQYPGSPATKKYVDDHAGVTYTAGANIQISAQNVISATDTKAEWGNITGTLSNQTDLQNALNTKANNVDVNTKTFFLSGTTSASLPEAQEAIDWYVAGNNPLIKMAGRLYMCNVFDAGYYALFTNVEYAKTSDNTKNSITNKIIEITLDANNNVTAISASTETIGDFLSTTKNYTTPYTPLYNGSPATKKYVDDNKVTKTSELNNDSGYITSAYHDSSKQDTLSAGTGINITNDVISNTGVTSVNGQTGDVTVSASEGNTKTFRLFFTSQLDVGQEIYDWYSAGKYPIIYFISTQNRQAQAYEFYGVGSNQIIFAATPRKDATNIKTDYKIPTLTISYSSGTVTSITESSVAINVLETNIDYSTPYTPLYNGSPATKKYVDDRAVPTSGTTGYVLTKNSTGYEWAAPSGGDVMVSSQSGNILTSGMKIWAGTQSNYESLGTYDNNTVYLTI